ncbi:V-type ATPase 116kDa subunit family protein [Candidatus Norongarragalina meridionalis]|nr:V-type ATPase 116kDa subunit family protein [Candidatus Norongarragalina meridionalis]
MLTMEPMAKVRVVCGKPATERVISALYEFGSVQITKSSVFDAGKPLDSFSPISNKLIALRSSEKMLGLKGGEAQARESLPSLRDALSEADGIDTPELEGIESELAEVRTKRAALRESAKALAPFKAVRMPCSAFTRNPRLRFTYFSLKGDFHALRKELDACHAEALRVADGKDVYVLVAAHEETAAKAQDICAKYAAAFYGIPVTGNAKTFPECVERTERDEKTVAAKEAALLKKKQAFAGKNAAAIVRSRKELEEHARLSSLPVMFGGTQNLVAIEGWLPAKNMPELERTIDKATAGKAAIEQLHVKESPPAVLKNPKLFKPFEFLVEFFSLPSPHEFDPTFFISLSFPLFFGMILGDIGYGIAALLLSLIMMAKIKKGFFRNVAGMMMLSAISTIIFGWIYGEFFGFGNIFGYQLHPMIPRAESEGLSFLMAFCIFIGLMHLALGFFIGLITALHEKQWKHAIAKASWLAVEFGLFCFLALSMESTLFEAIKTVAVLLPADAWGILTIGGIVGLAITEGVPALVELPGLVSNLFSYLRIMALGVSAVILALIIDKIPLNPNIVDPMSAISFFLFAAMFTLCHIGAFALGVFESSVQSLRLHYVEFFSKFYHGGGTPFVPLRRK